MFIPRRRCARRSASAAAAAQGLARSDGGLDLPALIREFLPWWRENAATVEHDADQGYAEAVPHLAFMGFLQRVVHGGGTVSREFAANRGRVDLLVQFGADRFAIELKRVPPRWRSPERVREDGIRQLDHYLEGLGLHEGWLILFDQRQGRTWDERLWQEDLVVNGRMLHLRGA